MPRVGRNIPCSHTTKAGRACRAWAVEGTDPPACSAHARQSVGAGAPPGNENARTHGFYARTMSEQELADLVIYAADMTLDDEIACARVALRRALAFIEQDPKELDAMQYLQALVVIFHGTRTVSRLLRDRKMLMMDSATDLATFFDEVLDEVGAELGIEV